MHRALDQFLWHIPHGGSRNTLSTGLGNLALCSQRWLWLGQPDGLMPYQRLNILNSTLGYKANFLSWKSFQCRGWAMPTHNHSTRLCRNDGYNCISWCPLQNAFVHFIASELHDSSVACVPFLILLIRKREGQAGKRSLPFHRARTRPHWTMSDFPCSALPTVPVASLFKTEGSKANNCLFHEWILAF